MELKLFIEAYVSRNIFSITNVRCENETEIN